MISISKMWRQFRAKRLPWASHEPWFQAVLHRVPALNQLGEPEKATLRQLVKEFLVSKKIFGAGGLDVDLGLRLKIATLACWPALHLGFGALDAFSSVIVYPEDFRAVRSHTDPATGLVRDYQQDMAGETSQHGPVVLSKLAIDAALSGLSGRIGNVVIHEIAHKIDALDGAIDGVPPLRPGMSNATFSATLEHAFLALRHDVQLANAAMDAYAAHSPPEFFAVASEYYFLAPEHLRAIYPGVFTQLQAFYGRAS
jgi:MtfA peptidase